MGFFSKIVLVIAVLSFAFVAQKFWILFNSANPPELNLKEYWGPGSEPAKSNIVLIKPFKINVDPEIIADLKKELSKNYTLHEPLQGVGFEYGFNSEYLREIIKYWRDTYLPKWSEREKYLKKFKHFSTNIQGLRIHLIHARPSDEEAEGKKLIPLLLLHGWPGSIREFYDIIPKLITPNPKSDFVFEVIAPSLPGYGWSQGSSKVNFGPTQIAVVLRNLMLQLDYKRFLIQGGDWGSLIGSHMAALFPENVIGYHSNMCVSMHPLSTFTTLVSRAFPSMLLDKKFSEFIQPNQLSNLLMETGYFHLQATKPDTIGAVLSSNPVGLAAYILEKFSTWTNSEYRSLRDGGLTKHYSLDALLDNVMIYYVTNSITSSMRLYAEAFSHHQRELGMDCVHVHIPTGCARFKHDLAHSTDCELKYKYKNLIHSTYHSNGGHFAAMELPQILYDDFIEFVKKIKNI